MSEPARQLAPTRLTGQVIETGAASLMEVISRAAQDPNTDVDKLERLLGMYERITGREAEAAYNDALNAAQEEMRPIAADANNPSTKSKYASYAALDRALRPIYTKHGFSLSFDTADGAAQDHVRLVCNVGHRSGHKQHPHLDMPADGKGAKGGDVMTKTHAIGAAITYGKRYLLGMVFNIVVGADDDGNSNGGREMGDAAKRAVAEINSCETPAELVLWKKNKSAGVMNVVTDVEGREVIALWNRRAAAMKGDDNG